MSINSKDIIRNLFEISKGKKNENITHFKIKLEYRGVIIKNERKIVPLDKLLIERDSDNACFKKFRNKLLKPSYITHDIFIITDLDDTFWDYYDKPFDNVLDFYNTLFSKKKYNASGLVYLTIITARSMDNYTALRDSIIEKIPNIKLYLCCSGADCSFVIDDLHDFVNLIIEELGEKGFGGYFSIEKTKKHFENFIDVACKKIHKTMERLYIYQEYRNIIFLGDLEMADIVVALALKKLAINNDHDCLTFQRNFFFAIKVNDREINSVFKKNMKDMGIIFFNDYKTLYKKIDAYYM